MGNGRKRPIEDFFRYGSVFTSRKFTLPHHPHSVKWKPVGSVYNCTTASTKNIVATLEPAALSAPPRLKIMETLHKPDPTRPQPARNGVPVVLIDYLLVTAMLLVTEEDEWMNVGPPVQTLTMPASPSLSSSAPAAIQEWRTMVHGETIRPSSPLLFRATTPSPEASSVDLPSRASSIKLLESDSAFTSPRPSPTIPILPSKLSLPSIRSPPLHSLSDSFSDRQASSSGRRQLPCPPIAQAQTQLEPRTDQPWLTPSFPVEQLYGYRRQPSPTSSYITPHCTCSECDRVLPALRSFPRMQLSANSQPSTFQEFNINVLCPCHNCMPSSRLALSRSSSKASTVSRVNYLRDGAETPSLHGRSQSHPPSDLPPPAVPPKPPLPPKLMAELRGSQTMSRSTEMLSRGGPSSAPRAFVSRYPSQSPQIDYSIRQESVIYDHPPPAYDAIHYPPTLPAAPTTSHV